MGGANDMESSRELFGTEEPSMNRLTRTTFGIFLGALVGLTAMGCNQEGDDIDRVQTNLVAKTLFEGEWWYGQTIVSVDSDEGFATLGGSYEGAMAMADLGLEPRSGFSSPTSLSIPRIRWVIDEDFLIAYRAYELIDGGNDDGDDEDFRGQPLAVFSIESHVDIRRQYNPVTGELLNVTVENTTDRRWYEREFMRVDWSQNQISSYYDVVNSGIFPGVIRRESAPFDIEPGSEFEGLPPEWRPQFVTVGQDEDYRYRDEWPTGTEDTIHYFSIVNNELVSPGSSCLFFGLPCQTAALTVRHAFLRVPPNHEYQAETQTHVEFDRFGTFRTYQRTFVRGGTEQEELAQRCSTDDDCTNGGSCDGDRNICIGGLTESFGETDFLTFYRPRHNLWKNQLSDVECSADWQCDGRWDDTPGLGFQSQCDLAAERCTNPFTDASGNSYLTEGAGQCTDCQEPRTVVYHLNKHFPRHQVKTAYEVMGDWNEVFMQGRRATLGMEPMQTNGAEIACQEDNPTAYCFCGSPEEAGGSCPYRYDPFQAPSDVPAEVSNPYDCYVQNAAGWEEPANPTTFDDYPADVYQYEFVGSECAFILKSNSCDVDPTQRCEELGDIRYQFFNYIDHAYVAFGGIALPMVDPTNGELITANANMSGTQLESIGTAALEYLPFLRGERDPDWYVEGENVRQYFANLGRIERPEGIGFRGGSGIEEGDPDRPEDLARLEQLNTRLDRMEPYFEQLQGSEGRANILQDRLLRLAGTDIERRMMRAMGRDYLFQMVDPDKELDMQAVETADVLNDDEMLDRISPFRGGLVQHFVDERRQENFFSSISHDPVYEVNLEAQYWQYWADAFAGRPNEEANIRLQQAFMYGVMAHEIGHSVGLRHNFAATYDRDNYPDSYFRVVTNNTLEDQSDDDDFVIPTLVEYDRPSLGGNGNGAVDGQEVGNYTEDLQRVRQNRFENGLGNVMLASIMDYPGDLGRLEGGLGRYDRAATLWNHFDLAEAFTECTECGTGGLPIRNSPRDSLHRVTYSHVAPRTLYQYYRGGEQCEVIADGAGGTQDVGCPFGEGSPAVADVPWHQRCITNPRNFERTRDPNDQGRDAGEPCGVGEANCVCSSSDQDVFAYELGLPGFDRDGTYVPVDYLFCTDDRTNDLSWCSRFDAGESFMETIDHWRTQWYNTYPNSYYRRFRRTNRLGGTAARMIFDAGKIYQHLFYRFNFEPGFASDSGPLGALDQYDAAQFAMNWLAEIITLPDGGVYELDEDANLWRQVSTDPTDIGQMDPDGDLGMVALEPGLGFPMWSSYQDGHEGFFRTQRAGVFIDKLFAIFALGTRDWGIDFTIDERQFVNFFDIFRLDITEMFGGFIQERPRLFAPRMTLDDEGNPVITPMSWARGALVFNGRFCVAEDDARGFIQVPCGPDREELYPAPALEGSMNNILRDFASVMALSTFPVYFDPSFERQLLIAKLGTGDQYRLPDSLKADGSPGCSYGDVTLNPVHVTDCEDPDYVVYTSEDLNQSYVAVKVQNSETFRDNEEFEQIGYNLLVTLFDLQEDLQAKRAELASLPPTTPPEEVAALRREVDRLQVEKQQRTSFLDYLLSIQDRFGVTSFFF